MQDGRVCSAERVCSVSEDPARLWHICAHLCLRKGLHPLYGLFGAVAIDPLHVVALLMEVCIVLVAADPVATFESKARSKAERVSSH